MAIRNIVKIGDDILRKVCRTQLTFDERLATILDDMAETMYKAEGVGLAAPQVGKALRVVVIDLDVLKDDMPEYAGFRHAYVNAHIVEYDDSKKESLDEGCLSIPGLHESVTRPTRIHVTYLDEDLAPHDEWVDGYLARVMQHEFDHLEGVMYVDRLSAFRKQMINGKLRAIAQGKFRCSYRVKPSRR